MRTSIPARQGIWQVVRWVRPSTVARHSWQIPIPHKGPRAWPVTDRRIVAVPDRKIAAATEVPGGTTIGRPSMVKGMLA